MTDFDWAKHEAELAERCRIADERTEAMVLAHPRLFKGKMPQYGFCSHEGWFDLQDKLFADIEEILAANNLDAELRETKEKFGVLGISLMMGGKTINHQTETGERGKAIARIRELILDAERISGFMCIRCGARCETKTHGGYMAPLCDAHGDAGGTPITKVTYAELKAMKGFKRTSLAHPSRGLVWSNPDVSDEVLVRAALTKGSKELIQEAVWDFGMPYVKARWDEIKDNLELPHPLVRLSDMSGKTEDEIRDRLRQSVERILLELTA